MWPGLILVTAGRGYLSQCADVTTAFRSVNHLNRTGHGVWLDGAESFMMNKLTGEITQIDRNGKDFTMEMRVIPPDELEVFVESEGFAWHQPLPSREIGIG